MKIITILSTMLFSIAHLVNADMLWPTCSRKQMLKEDGTVLTNYLHLEVPEGLAPQAQYLVYGLKWAAPSGALPKNIGIFTANDDGTVKMDFPDNEEGITYAVNFNKTDGTNRWQIPCINN